MTIQRGNVNDHTRSCPHKQCPHAISGCAFTGTPSLVARHEAAECEWRLVACPESGCGARVAARDLAAHSSMVLHALPSASSKTQAAQAMEPSAAAAEAAEAAQSRPNVAEAQNGGHRKHDFWLFRSRRNFALAVLVPLLVALVYAPTGNITTVLFDQTVDLAGKFGYIQLVVSKMREEIRDAYRLELRSWSIVLLCDNNGTSVAVSLSAVWR